MDGWTGLGHINIKENWSGDAIVTWWLFAIIEITFGNENAFSTRYIGENPKNEMFHSWILLLIKYSYGGVESRTPKR